MDELRAVFAAMGLANISSVLASGNVIFESETTPDPKGVSKALFGQFGLEIGVIVRPIAYLEKLIAANPFAQYEAGPDCKFYLTMCERNVGNSLEGIKNAPGDFDVVLVHKAEYFCVAFRQPSGRFGAGLDKLVRLFKDNTITTRNWSTIIKIVKKAEQ